MKRISLSFLIVILVLPARLMGQIYVSSAGADTNAGTYEFPFQTLTKALSIAKSDSLVHVRGGIYSLSSSIQMTDSGSEGHWIKVWAYPGETPVFDFSPMTGSSDGFKLKGNYYHLQGIEEKNAGHNGIYITGSHNIVERCTIHENGNTGLHMRYGASYNLILNCDSYLNYDPPIGGNADGFSAKWEVGPGNVFKGCRSYNNSDDGWDLWMGQNSVNIDSCWSFRNGVDSWHSGSVSGNGNGFKLGGNYVAAPHYVHNCVSFDNAGNTGRGFDENNNLAGQTLFDCTAYRNKSANYSFSNTVTQGQHNIKNCISYIGAVVITSGTREANSWQGFDVSSADFVSLDTSLATAPRNSDGSLPVNGLFRLVGGSSLIDVGVDVGLPYSGKAPDLGAFESGDAPDAVHFEGVVVPSSVRLFQNYPNPFNPTTLIRFQLPGSSRVTLKVFNMLGEEVATLVDGIKDAGDISAEWDGGWCPSGMYFYRFLAVPAGEGSSAAARGYSETKMLILIK